MTGESGKGNVVRCQAIGALAASGHQHCHSHVHTGGDVHEQVGRLRQR